MVATSLRRRGGWWIADVNSRGNFRKDLHQLVRSFHADKMFSQHLRWGGANNPPQNGYPWCIGNQRLAIATPDQDRGLSGGGPRKFQNQSRLSDSGLAGDDRDLLLSSRSALPDRLKKADLRRAPGEMDGFVRTASYDRRRRKAVG